MALERMLPSGWRLVRKARIFEIECTTPIWVLHGNAVNADPRYFERQRARWQRMKRRSPPTHAALIFRYEPRWSSARIARVRRHNRPILTQIRKIRRGIQGRWKRGAEAFRNQTAALRRRLKTLPYLTERYAVFLVQERGISGSFVHVFPEHAARSASHVRKRVLAFLRRHKAR